MPIVQETKIGKDRGLQPKIVSTGKTRSVDHNPDTAYLRIFQGRPGSQAERRARPWHRNQSSIRVENDGVVLTTKEIIEDRHGVEPKKLRTTTEKFEGSEIAGIGLKRTRFRGRMTTLYTSSPDSSTTAAQQTAPPKERVKVA